jgi:hypothetical protein
MLRRTGLEMFPRLPFQKRSHLFLLGGSVFCAFFLSSCTTHNSDGSVSRHYFGYTVVKFPRQVSNLEGFDIKEISNVGFAVGRPSGVSLGYSKDKIVSMPPDGRMYVEVHTEDQFKKAEALVREFEKIGIGVSYQGSKTNQHISKK